tara:strand:+ start:259 stop:645 length:387 start_codon:yes stop_codon:yes gene_type:complete
MAHANTHWTDHEDGRIRDINRVGELITWDELGVMWDRSVYNWEDVTFIYDVFGRSPRQKKELKELYDLLELDEKVKVVTLICKMKGKYPIKQTRYKLTDLNVKAEDIKLMVDEVLDHGKSVMVENVDV